MSFCVRQGSMSAECNAILLIGVFNFVINCGSCRGIPWAVRPTCLRLSSHPRISKGIVDGEPLAWINDKHLADHLLRRW